eukprot:jgi/Mesen1/472/ME000101S10709
MVRQQPPVESLRARAHDAVATPRRASKGSLKGQHRRLHRTPHGALHLLVLHHLLPPAARLRRTAPHPEGELVADTKSVCRSGGCAGICWHTHTRAHKHRQQQQHQPQRSAVEEQGNWLERGLEAEPGGRTCRVGAITLTGQQEQYSEHSGSRPASSISRFLAHPSSTARRCCTPPAAPRFCNPQPPPPSTVAHCAARLKPVRGKEEDGEVEEKGGRGGARGKGRERHTVHQDFT